MEVKVKELEERIAEVVHKLNHLRNLIILDQLTDKNLPNGRRNQVHIEILEVSAQRFVDYVLTGE